MRLDERDTYWWRTGQLVPAPPGWRAGYLDQTNDKVYYLPVIGWAVQQAVARDRYDDATPDEDEGERIVTLVYKDIAYISEVDDDDDLVGLFGPGEPDLDTEQIAAIRADRVRTHGMVGTPGRPA